MKTSPDTYNFFSKRHIGPSDTETKEMLKALDLSSLEELIDQTVPSSIRLQEDLNLPEPLTEYKFLEELQKTADKNKVYKSYIGLGYYDCLTPGVIERNIFENPGWYTQYTPYQAEISQGRLEALLNFQTVVSDLTMMEVSNASLLDEATAAAEAMTMLHRVGKRKEANKFFVSKKCFPQTIDVLKTRAEPLGIELTIGDHKKFEYGAEYFGAMIQYPDSDGDVHDYSGFVESCHNNDILVSVATDLLSLTLLTPPGEFGADVVVGSAQRFGVPMGYGGPHAAFFATRESFVRQVPGRIIGVSIDSRANPAYRMALQTREQHIKRERATSNICTAQALLAIMAGMYAVYHGGEGLKSIACRIHATARFIEQELAKMGYKQANKAFFDTLKVNMGKEARKAIEKIKLLSESEGINFRYIDKKHIGISIDETTESDDVKKLLRIFSAVNKSEYEFRNFEQSFSEYEAEFPKKYLRQSDYLDHPVFEMYRSETKMLRYIKKLESRDLSLTTSMIPLGSCTMKLNATTEMLPVTWPEFSKLHPFAPKNQTLGYQEVFSELESYLSEITGLPGVSLQPNSGAQGEYAGLLVIRDYYKDKGEHDRNVTLIPSSAHGTNPASAIMAGMRVVVVGCDDKGNIDMEDLKKKAEENKDSLAALMITYPSTHGVFEEGVIEMCDIVHRNGGQVYMDGANMNAQVGLTSPSIIGADVCHINLHKTFSIPHGGGGPGMGPICVAEHLAPYLPGHPIIDPNNGKHTASVSASPWGSSSILLVSYAYIKLLGKSGVKEATEYAILNANYLKSRLEKYYEVLYTGSHGRVAHEFILDLRRFKKGSGVDVEDVAKRLMDYGFHAPTVSWPVAGTMMIEPTESEAKDELDRFCDAMISIHNEIGEISEGKADKEDNLLKGAPHTAREALIDEWKHPYSRKDAVYPLLYTEDYKYWPPVGRINNPHGDRNLMCSCPPLESFEEGS